MKKKLLFIGITMNAAGTEKSFLSFSSCIDYEKYDVDLLLAKKEGLFLDLVPEQVNIIEMPQQYADMFTLTGKTAKKTIWNCFVKNKPLMLFELLPYYLKMMFNRKKRSDIAMKLWCHLLKYFPKLDASDYDAVVAYWGDKTMFYMVDCVEAKKKITWLHFDYANPKRDDSLYLRYFEACDKIITVSDTVNQALMKTLPTIADKCMVIENITNAKLIRDLALRGDEFPDRSFQGKRILSVGRLAHQKGYDLIVPVLRKLRDDGYYVRWYIIGDGEERDELIKQIMAAGVPDMLFLLGTTVNPYSYIRDADLFVMPSRHEGKPITVEEAKVLMKPMVVTNYLSASEQLEGGKLGVICDMTSDSIYAAVRKMLDSPEIGDAFTEELARRDFGNTKEIEKFYNLID